MRRPLLLLLVLLLNPLSAQAWWSDEWNYRKQLTLDTTADGAGITEDLQNVPVLVRLHTGNFGYFLDIQPKGEDIRFVAGDDQTPLKYHIERFDAINEIALIWVQVPELKASAQSTSIWMYYGNPTAVTAEDAGGSYSPEQALVLHFDSDEARPRDVTAYANTISRFDAEQNTASLIGDGVSFTGQGGFEITDSPVLEMNPEKGWAWSAWLKLDAEQGSAVLFERRGESGSLVLGIDGFSPYARMVDANGAPVETPRNGRLTAGAWHHVALNVSAGRLAVYIDGSEVSWVDTPVTALAGDITVGGTAEGSNGLVGKLDELNIYNAEKTAAWFRAAISSQGPAADLLVYGEDGAKESGGEPSYFAVTLKNVTVDGWVVIVVLAIMSAISWVVMVFKGMSISSVRKDNRAFLQQFGQMGIDQIANLDHEETEDEREMSQSPLLMAMSGDHEHFASSTIFRIYHAGIREMRNRMPDATVAQSVGAKASDELVLSSQAIDAIRATMDGVLTRENQKLNGQMVLLTIAISGGPFLGLLGTVVGVMITFAAIAASGDVNVNAIAPGIAAALVATVAGLAVAIPALFGYNYLGSRIKEISADMHVFVDEFIAKIAEQHS